MFNASKNILTTIAIAAIMNGCAVITPQVTDFDPQDSVNVIETPHTNVLSCVGEMIDKGPYSPVLVNVHRVRDETVPEDFEDRGLTGGGMWLATTAISRMNTDKVVAVLARYSEPDLLPDDMNQIDLRGAFTQFDRLGVTGDLALQTVFRKFGFDLGGSEDYELVTGDFTTSINGRVLNSTAIGMIVLTTSRDGAVFWDDGDESVAISLNGRVREGRQNAQRHIIEAATVLHIASYYNLDYKSCLKVDERFVSTVENSTAATSSEFSTQEDKQEFTETTLIEDLCQHGCIEYTVQPGDHLHDIVATNYQNDPYEDILPLVFAVNPTLTDPNQIEVGRKLLLPQMK